MARKKQFDDRRCFLRVSWFEDPPNVRSLMLQEATTKQFDGRRCFFCVSWFQDPPNLRSLMLQEARNKQFDGRRCLVCVSWSEGPPNLISLMLQVGAEKHCLGNIGCKTYCQLKGVCSHVFLKLINISRVLPLQFDFFVCTFFIS